LSLDACAAWRARLHRVQSYATRDRLRNKRGLADTWLIARFGFCDLLKPGLPSPGTNILTSPVDCCRDLQRTQESLIQHPLLEHRPAGPFHWRSAAFRAGHLYQQTKNK
jgi:hypothetical protein